MSDISQSKNTGKSPPLEETPETASSDAPLTSIKATQNDQRQQHLSENSLDIEATIPWKQLTLPESLFNPSDAWARHSRLGLLSLDDWAGMRVAEVGVGTGVTTGVLLREKPEIRRLFASDLNAEALPVAKANIALIAPQSSETFIHITT